MSYSCALSVSRCRRLYILFSSLDSGDNPTTTLPRHLAR